MMREFFEEGDLISVSKFLHGNPRIRVATSLGVYLYHKSDIGVVFKLPLLF